MQIGDMRLREAVAWMAAVLATLLWLAARAPGAPACPSLWHGGAPGDSPAGSCWCGAEDGYCMCTPSLAIDLVIELGDRVALVQRADNGLLATMGGFVDVAETVEAAVARELEEETGLALASPPQLLGVYSDPRRDTRRHTVSAVYVASGRGEIKAGSDARGVRLFDRPALARLSARDMAFDHHQILADYLVWHAAHRDGQWSVPAQPAPDGSQRPWVRSVCQ